MDRRADPRRGQQLRARSRGAGEEGKARDEGRGRRPSQWENVRGKTLKAAAGAANNIGRWFGVAGDAEAMHAMHQEYNRQKTCLKRYRISEMSL